LVTVKRKSRKELYLLLIVMCSTSRYNKTFEGEHNITLAIQYAQVLG
jgi:hypothetical protein